MTGAAPGSGGDALEQRLRLDSRQVLIVEPHAGGAIAGVSGTYLVRRQERVLARRGSPVGRRSGSIDFVSGSAAAFPDAVRCAATGVLEQRILDADGRGLRS